MFKKVITSICCAALVALPALPASAPVGHISAGNGAIVSGVQTVPGTTVFDGDTVAASGGGGVTVDLRGGSVLELSTGSETRLTAEGRRVDAEIARGGVKLTSSALSPVSGRLADLAFSPASTNTASVGWIGLTDATHVVVFAEKGDWAAYTAADGRTVLLRPGEELKGAISAGAVQETEGAQQQKKKKKKLAVIWIGTALAGTAIGVGMAFGMSECNVNSGPCPPAPVVSPVTP
ncbi:MAG TPA: hypothetical protein VNJ52_07865 [Patescibacteria group bacterium]|nr:hypothetical protein [Patescibacteria group bacterium]